MAFGHGEVVSWFVGLLACLRQGSPGCPETQAHCVEQAGLLTEICLLPKCMPELEVCSKHRHTPLGCDVFITAIESELRQRPFKNHLLGSLSL